MIGSLVAGSGAELKQTPKSACAPEPRVILGTLDPLAWLQRVRNGGGPHRCRQPGRQAINGGCSMLAVAQARISRLGVKNAPSPTFNLVLSLHEPSLHVLYTTVSLCQTLLPCPACKSRVCDPGSWCPQQYLYDRMDLPEPCCNTTNYCVLRGTDARLGRLQVALSDADKDQCRLFNYAPLQGVTESFNMQISVALRRTCT